VVIDFGAGEVEIPNSAGICYTGVKDRQEVRDTDEWQGHVPVHRYDHIGPWRKIK
jgi:hypothetical protein